MRSETPAPASRVFSCGRESSERAKAAPASSLGAGEASPGLGSSVLPDGRTRFLVWAPKHERVGLHVTEPRERRLEMANVGGGYHEALVEDAGPGTLYSYALTGREERPDPASRCQPRGVHGISCVVGRAFDWKDASWRGLSLGEQVIYEIHVGTFTREGTFDAAIRHLDGLRELGVTTLELMPVGQFPGERNWGYDGVQPFAVQTSYGGREGLKRLVDACHLRGMALCLDVVYNHLGPEGNYLGRFGPYFTDRYRSPWGEAINFDGPGSDEVRRYFIENALQWIDEFHIDMLRLDASDTIMDCSARPFLRELGLAVGARAHELGRQVHLVAETASDDPRFVLPAERMGHGMSGLWNDPFHHALHSLLTGEQDGYYADYGRVAHLAKAHTEGFVYTGEYSKYRGRRHGWTSRDIAAGQMVVCCQNHDQVGNRMLGERLGALAGFEGQKLAAGVVLLAPFVPLLFMGEEYGETAPFQYFVSHGDTDLVEAVRKGRREEFAAFRWKGEPPDPQSPETFSRSRLDRALMEKQPYRTLRELYRELLELRCRVPALSSCSKVTLEAWPLEEERLLAIRRWEGESETLAYYHFGENPLGAQVPVPPGGWRKLLDSEDERWLGRGSRLPDGLEAPSGEAHLEMNPRSFGLYTRS